MKLYLTIVVLFFFINPFLKGQVTRNYFNTEHVSPSSTAASITKYGDISMNSASGVVNFSIPLFTVLGDELKLPIVLNYGYSGLRPAENAGWVGLGWSLENGGVITKTIKGKIDNSLDQNGFSGAYVTNKLYNGLQDVETADFQQFLSSVNQGVYDTEPDVYSFSFPGYSGKFIIFQGQCYSYPNQKIKIYGDGESDFTIVTEDGTRYLFGGKEITRSKGNPSANYNLTPYLSSFYLTKIENAAKTEKIYFNYTHEGDVTQLGPLTQVFKKYETFYDESILYDPTFSYPTFVNPLRLTSIESDKHRVNFIISTAKRLDLTNMSTYPLGEIQVYDKVQNNKIKTFGFNTGYFGDNDFLKLISITEKGNLVSENEQNGLTHSFVYEESSVFPKKPNLMTDHYGYYNGRGSADILIPDYIYPSGPNRNPRSNFAQLGALKKIIFPTGGYSEFEYEGNKISNGRAYEEIERTRATSALLNSTSATIDFSLTKEQDVQINVDRHANRYWEDGNIHSGDVDFIILDQYTRLPVVSGRVVHQDGPFTFVYRLPVGSYSLYCQADAYEDQISAQVTYKRQSKEASEGKDGPGIRVKRIRSFPVFGFSTLKEYKYTDEEGFGTGVDLIGSVYQQDMIQEVVEEPQGFRERNATIYNSFISENSSGAPIFYRSILEIVKGSNEVNVTRNDYGIFDYFNAQPVLEKTIIYKDSSLGLKSIKKIEYENSLVLGKEITSVRPFLDMEILLNGSSPIWGYSGPTKHFSAKVFSYSQGYSYVKKVVTTDYFGVDSIISVSLNDYDALNMKVKINRKTESDGGWLVTKYKYAVDYSASIAQRFIDANVVSPIWEEQQWRKRGIDSVLVNSKLIAFNTQFRPSTIFSLEEKDVLFLNNENLNGNKFTDLISDTRYQPKIFYEYNSDGQLINQNIVSGVRKAYKWGYGTTRKLYLKGILLNGFDNEVFIEDFEDDSSSGIVLNNVHGGYKAVLAPHTINWTPPNTKPYLITYWSFEEGEWKYKTDNFVSGTYVLNAGSIFDDIAIYPSEAQLTAFSYKTGVGLKSETDSKGFTKSYEYDSFNRLSFIKDEKGNVIRKYDYNYAVNDNIYYNQEISGVFYKKDCGIGTISNSVIFMVPAGQFSSLVSQQDADNQARVNFESLGQRKANIEGICGASIKIAFANYTSSLPSGVGQVKTGFINFVTMKNKNNNKSYYFDGGQIEAGFVYLPKGIYDIRFDISGGAYEIATDVGWTSVNLTSIFGFRMFHFGTEDYEFLDVNLNEDSAMIAIYGAGGGVH